MNLTELFLAQLEQEAPRTSRALDRVPEGRGDWKPHEKSMSLQQLSTLVAGMSSWIPMMINGDELDLNPPGGSQYKPSQLRTSRELVQAFDKGVAEARKALSNTNDDHLGKPWRLLVAGKVVSEQPRHVVLRDTFMHLAHHRGQLTVYLRLNDVPVPSIYGPTADELGFG